MPLRLRLFLSDGKRAPQAEFVQTVIKNFSHTPGKHCGSTALMNHMRFAIAEGKFTNPGFDLALEANCFGLGAGLSFSYLVAAESPQNYLMGRALRLHENFFENLKIPYEAHEFPAPAELTAFAKEKIAAGFPVIVQSDVHFLPYYTSPLHFTGHTFTAVGFDAEGFVTSDTHFKELQKADFASFEKAVSYPSPIFEGVNKCYLVLGEPPDTSPGNLEAAIRQSLSQMLADFAEGSVRHAREGNSAGFYTDAATGAASLGAMLSPARSLIC